MGRYFLLVPQNSHSMSFDIQSKPVDDAKLSHYTSGSLRKSRREKEQDAADAKKKEEEENAAQAYAEFLDAFEGQDVEKKKAGPGFVKADSRAAYIPLMPAADRAKLQVCLGCCPPITMY